MKKTKRKKRHDEQAKFEFFDFHSENKHLKIKFNMDTTEEEANNKTSFLIALLERHELKEYKVNGLPSRNITG